VEREAQGHATETFVTASDQFSPGEKPGRPSQRRGVLIIFYVALCMKWAQTKQNEALGMRVTATQAVCVPSGDGHRQDVPGPAFLRVSEEIE
jgi:hypothetical protein